MIEKELSSRLLPLGTNLKDAANGPPCLGVSATA
jgi:hypothetical protein